MKKSKIAVVLNAAIAFLLTGIDSQAQLAGPTFSFHENGQGQLELPTGVVIPIPGVLATDPGPGGLTSALAFTTHPQEQFFVVGDVFLLDGQGQISDVLRFNPGTITGTMMTQVIFLYSNDSAGLPADTELPGAFYANPVSLPENENAATSYTPLAGQPGFEAGFPLPLTYQVFSTPDGGPTLLLLGLAVSGLGLLRRKLPA